LIQERRFDVSLKNQLVINTTSPNYVSAFSMKKIDYNSLGCDQKQMINVDGSSLIKTLTYKGAGGEICRVNYGWSRTIDDAYMMFMEIHPEWAFHDKTGYQAVVDLVGCISAVQSGFDIFAPELEVPAPECEQ
jgi:hypothetical protein